MRQDVFLVLRQLAHLFLLLCCASTPFYRHDFFYLFSLINKSCGCNSAPWREEWERMGHPGLSLRRKKLNAAGL